jgi:hypothetical protein
VYELDQAQAQARVREIMGKLAAVRFADLVLPNEVDREKRKQISWRVKAMKEKQ